MSVRWRHYNRVLHRDIGYFSVALIIIYGISGIAVNHVADWNPNYSKSREIIETAPFEHDDRDSVVAEAMRKLGLTEEPLNYFRADDETAQLFYRGTTYSIDLPTGAVLRESNPPRPVLYEMNQLHLNHVKGIWTYIADLFAVALIFLGVSGLFVLRGRLGLAGRGKWLLAAGTLLPLLYWVWYTAS